MRSFLQRNKWATYIVVGLFLLATSGTAISRMTCLEGGHSVVSLGMATDCCPEPEHGDFPTVKATCCEFDLVKGDGSDYLPNTYIDLLPAALILDHAMVSIALSTPVRATTWLCSRPPPLSVTDRLAVISVQRI